MKKRVLCLAMAGLLTSALLAACGGAGSAAPGEPMSAPAASAPMAEDYAGDSNDLGWSGSGYGPTQVSAASEEQGRGDETAQSAKRIYTAQLDMETKSFDEAAEKIGALVEEIGGWFQESSVNDYGGGYRHASYTVRVPSEKFQDFLTRVGELCHVTYQNAASEDVTEYYYDTAGRLKTQRTKLERLQDLLGRAESMEDIITIESAISETESAIESLSGELRYYDAQVDYSTVHLNLDEVYRLTDTEQPVNTFADRLGAAMESGWRGFVSGTQDLLIALAYGWMWLVCLAVILILALFLVTRRRRKRAALRAGGEESIHRPGNKAEKPDDKPEKP